MKLVVGFAQIEMGCGLFNNKKINDIYKKQIRIKN